MQMEAYTTEGPLPSVVIADGLEIVREGIARKLEEHGETRVAGIAADGFSTLKLCRSLKPNILVLDLALTRPSGMETLEKVRASSPETKVIVLLSEVTAGSAFAALAKGAIAVVPKQAKTADFVCAINAAINGFTYMPTEFVESFVQSKRNVSRTGNLFGLSPRELEVLEACTDGQSTKEVAQLLDISVRTVETHRNSIYRKTDCSCLAELKQISATICGIQHDTPFAAMA